MSDLYRSLEEDFTESFNSIKKKLAEVNTKSDNTETIISELKSELNEAGRLLKQMDLEVLSLPNKLRIEFSQKNRKNKADYEDAKKTFSRLEENFLEQKDKNKLMAGSRFEGQSAEQRELSRLEFQNQKLEDAKRTGFATVITATDTMRELGRQKEILERNQERERVPNPMLNFQLSYLKYIASEHPEDLAPLFDGKFKENLMETTVELLFQNDSQSKDPQNGIRRSNLENLELPAPAANILNNNDMDFIPEVIGFYEDNDKVLEAIKNLKYKRPTPSSMREENSGHEKSGQYGKSREEAEKARKEETSTNPSEEHRMEVEDKFKGGFRDDVNSVKMGSAYPDYSKNSQGPYHSNVQFPHGDNKRFENNNNANEQGKRHAHLAYQASNNTDQRNMGNFNDYQQHYHQNQMNFGGGKPGNFPAAPFFPNQMHPPQTYNSLPNYMGGFQQGGQPFYGGGYPMYPTNQYQGNGNNMNQEGSGYRSGGGNMQSSGKNYKNEGKSGDNKQKHSDKSAR